MKAKKNCWACKNRNWATWPLSVEFLGKAGHPVTSNFKKSRNCSLDPKNPGLHQLSGCQLWMKLSEKRRAYSTKERGGEWKWNFLITGQLLPRKGEGRRMKLLGGKHMYMNYFLHYGKTNLRAPFAFKTAIKNVQAPFLKHLHRYLYQHVNDKLITPRMKKCFIIVYLFLCCFKIIRKIRIWHKKNG